MHEKAVQESEHIILVCMCLTQWNENCGIVEWSMVPLLGDVFPTQIVMGEIEFFGFYAIKIAWFSVAMVLKFQTHLHPCTSAIGGRNLHSYGCVAWETYQ